MTAGLATASVGLTGGIASGKTAVADAFARLGAPVVDADQLARDVVAPGEPALDEIEQVFGSRLLDENGALDRAAMRRAVFNDDDARRRLESIVHPRVREGLERARREATASYIVMVVPLLAEGGLGGMMDRILVVDVPEKVQHERLMQRDGIEPALAQRMIRSQASRQQRLAIADDVFVNTRGLDTIANAVETLHSAYSRLAGQSAGAVPPMHLPANP